MAGPISPPPVIPRPPPRGGGAKRGRRGSGRRGLSWLAALALGATLGALGYEWIPGITVSFDYLQMILRG